MLQFATAGESHGQALVAWISGLPAGLRIDLRLHQRRIAPAAIGIRARRKAKDRERPTPRRWRASGTGRRSARPSRCASKTAIGPIGRRPWRWRIAKKIATARRPLTAPRPGHADLAGGLKFNFHDARYILERASARETAARVALGAVAKLLLREFGCEILSHVVAVGHVRLERRRRGAKSRRCARISIPRCAAWIAEIEARMKQEVDQVLRAGDTVGGIFEVVAHGVPPGLGSHAQWDAKLDGQLARAIMSIQAVKAVEIGSGG